jgi:hypothetical protein
LGPEVEGDSHFCHIAGVPLHKGSPVKMGQERELLGRAGHSFLLLQRQEDIGVVFPGRFGST